MRGDAGRAVSDSSRSVAHVAVLVALALERACLDEVDGDRGLIVYQSGPGPDRARATASQALARGAVALVSWGLAGGLVPAVAPGDVVIPERVVSDRGIWLTDSRWLGALHAALAARFTLHSGALASVDRVLESPASKALAARSMGAVAVDTESAAIAAVAADAGVPFAVVRVVADGCDDALPAHVEQWIDAAGERRLAPLARAALAPAQWPGLWRLARRSRIATGTLRELARALGAQRFCRPAGGAAAADATC